VSQSFPTANGGKKRQKNHKGQKGTGLLGCRLPAPWDFAVEGKGREGWRLGGGEGKPPPFGARAAEPPGVPRVGAGGRRGSTWHHSNLGGFCRRVGDMSCVPAGAALVGNAAFPCLLRGTGCLV